jgi:cytidylate kinase
MSSPIVLLGPLQSGKTTVGKLLSDQLGLALVHFATIAPEYRKEIGHDEAGEREAGERVVGSELDAVRTVDGRRTAAPDPLSERHLMGESRPEPLRL